MECSHFIGASFNFKFLRHTQHSQEARLFPWNYWVSSKEEGPRSYLIFRNAAMPNTNRTTAITVIVMAAMLPAQER